MSLSAVKRMTIIFASSLLLLQPAIVFSADPAGANATQNPAPVVVPAPSLQTSADMKVPANINYKKAKGTLHKKGGFTTAAPTVAAAANENYLNLGPNGTATPVCPADSSRCPDVNNMSGLVKLSPSTIALVCPDICSVTRTGTLDDGDAPVVCPAGYSQLVAYNVKKEWVKNPGGGSTTPVPVPTNDYDTYKKYWHDYKNYHCKQAFVKYGNTICFPYGGEGVGPPLRSLPGPAGYDVVYRDQWCSKESWGMHDNGDQPFAWLNYANAADNNWTKAYVENNFFNAAKETAAGVRTVFGEIRDRNKLPSVWVGMDNRNYLTPANGRWANWYHGENWQVDGGGRSGNYVDGCQSYTYTIDWGYGMSWTETVGEMKTYNDPQCTNPALAHSVCGMPADGTPDHYQQTRTDSGACTQIYVRMQIPVFELWCEKLKQPVLKETGMPAPTSLICGRIKGSWE